MFALKTFFWQNNDFLSLKINVFYVYLKKTIGNIIFSSEIHSFISELRTQTYSCKYYNEYKFNSVLPKHQEDP